MRSAWARLACIGAVALVCAAPGGCRRPNDNAKIPAVKIGVLYPLSGDLRQKGVESVNGATLAIEEINAAGGIVALKGAKLEPVLGDSQGQPEAGVSEARRLIGQEGVSVVIGAYQSSVTKLVTQVGEQLQTPVVASMGVADLITERGFRYTFRIAPKAQYYGRDQVQFLKELGALAGYNVKRVALLYENTDFGTATALGQKRALKANGFQLVADVSYVAAGVEDLSREVAQVLASRPDAILETTYVKDSILIRRELARAGWDHPLIDTAGGTISDEYMLELGELAEGTLSSGEYYAVGSDNQRLAERYKARFNSNINGDAAYAYQAVWVVKNALEHAGSTEPQRLRDAIAATDIPRGPQMILPATRLSFDETGQNTNIRLFIIQIQDGKWVPVWPPEFATAKVRLAPGRGG